MISKTQKDYIIEAMKLEERGYPLQGFKDHKPTSKEIAEKLKEDYDKRLNNSE